MDICKQNHLWADAWLGCLTIAEGLTEWLVPRSEPESRAQVEDRGLLLSQPSGLRVRSPAQRGLRQLWVDWLRVCSIFTCVCTSRVTKPWAQTFLVCPQCCSQSSDVN